MDLATWLREASTPRGGEPEFVAVPEPPAPLAAPPVEVSVPASPPVVDTIPEPVEETATSEFTDAINALENLDLGDGTDAVEGESDESGSAAAGE
jgi:hypothetical protein